MRSADGGVEAGLPGEAGAGDDAASDAPIAVDQRCDDGLVEAWKAHRPSFGLTSTQAASVYDQAIDDVLTSAGVRGAVVSVVRSGKLVLAKGYGSAEAQTLPLVQPDSTFRVLGQTFPITAAAIFKLIEDGKLALDDKAFTLLKVEPAPGLTANPALDAITVRHLLQHTAGWSSEVLGDPMFDTKRIASIVGGPSPAPCTSILRYMRSRPLTWAPGTVMRYSNFGYCVLGAIVEAVSGTDYGSYVKSAILEPSGAGAMTLGHTLATQKAGDEVSYFDYPGAPLVESVFGPEHVPAPYGQFYLEAWAATAGWVGTAMDVLRFQTALDGRSPRGPSLLRPESLAAMLANPHVLVGTDTVATEPGSSTSWTGAGWNVEPDLWFMWAALSGSLTVQVRAEDGFGWSAMLNTTPEDLPKQRDALLSALWIAHTRVAQWPDVDLFDHFGAISPWMAPDAFEALLDDQATKSMYPSRIEGRQQAGALQFRARSSPTHGWPVASLHDADCPTYRDAASLNAAKGYQAVSLQTFVDANGVRRYQAAWAKPD